MHRSGTSLLANWLVSCGLHLGNNLLGKGLGNSKGHFEDLDFVRLHDKFLKQMNINDGGFTNLDNIPLIPNTLVSNEISELLDDKNTIGIDWGWKDPRTCLFLPYYEKHLPDAKVITIFRHPLKVVDSLLRRKESKFARRLKSKTGIKKKIYQCRMFIWFKYRRINIAKQYLNAWVFYNKRIIEFLDNKPNTDCLLINLPELEKNQSLIFDTCAAWGFSLKQTSLNTVFDNHLLQNSVAKFTTAEVEDALTVFDQLEKLSTISRFQHAEGQTLPIVKKTNLEHFC